MGHLRLLPAVLAAALLAPAAASAQTAPTWLCDPAKATDACRPGLDATRLTPAGKVLGVERTSRASKPEVDCFYVYPTVSGQPRPVARKTIDPELRAIARFQASRYTEHCRVYAPVYRQITLQGLLQPDSVTAADRELAYTDVRDAWRSYLRTRNKGRGVVFVGHSQGTFVLRRLIAQEVDPKPAVRRRMVSALLLGGNVVVARGKDTGGDFDNVRACRRATQLGCVVAFSLFNDTVPNPSRFGRPTSVLERKPLDPAKFEVLCTNPAALGGGSGRFVTYLPTSTFPGTLGTVIKAQLGTLPKVSTPWLSFRTAYSGRCARSNGASVLQVSTAPGGRVLKASPDATWGLHLGDANLPYGNLVDLVGRQVAAYGSAR